MKAYKFLKVDKYVKETKSTVVNINWAVERAEAYARQEKLELLERIIPKTCFSHLCLREMLDNAVKEVEKLKKAKKKIA